MRTIERVSAASFIGRESELAELEASLADAAAGHPQLVFVAGESGVGKSRLLAEFERRAEALGSRVIGGECIELGDDELPYAPLVGAVRPLARADDPAFGELPEFARAELARLAPELGAPPAGRAEDRDGEIQRRVFDALLSLLERLGAEAPVVFWLEDLHWADRSTRSFLAFLSASLRDERVLVLSTYRSDELHRRHPLRPLLNELERGACARRLDLARFDRGELSAQLADILGNAPGDDVVERLYSRSEGNPLFTEELLAGGLDGQGSLPPTLREALLTRIEALPRETRAILGLLAVAGRSDDASLVAAGDHDATAVREALREALAYHLVVADASGRFGFRHALFREVLYDDLLPGERSELHLALARALSERTDVDDGPWLRTAIAHHFHMAGAQPEALRAAIEAAERTEQIHAYGEAAALLDRALALWPRVPDAESLLGCDLIDLLVRASRAHYLFGDDVRNAALLEQAVAESDPEGDPRRAADLLGELANTQWSLGQADHSRATLERAVALLPDEPTVEGARILGHQARFDLLQGKFKQLVELEPRARELTDALGLDGVKANVLNRIGVAYFPLGDPDRGEALIREAIELGRSGATNDGLATAYVNYADVLHLFGRSTDALAFLDSVIGDFDASNRSAIWIGLLRSEILFDIGEWDAAEAAIPSPRGLARAMTRVNYEVRIADLALARGDVERARPPLESSREIIAGSVEPQFIAAVAALAAELECRERNVDTAREIISEALDRIQYCTEDGARIARIAAAGATVEAEAAENARDLGDSDALTDAIARAELMAALTEASTEGWPGTVEKAAMRSALAEAARAKADPETAALWLEAAEAWAAVPRPYREALARRRAAEAFLAAEEREAAAREATTAHEMASRLGSRWLVEDLVSLAARARFRLGSATDEAPIAEEPGVPFGLTERELQVLALVASGATNRAIAGELFIAEKTASVHVSRILGKLDVKSRTEAAAVAHRQGLAGASGRPEA